MLPFEDEINNFKYAEHIFHQKFIKILSYFIVAFITLYYLIYLLLTHKHIFINKNNVIFAIAKM